MDKKLKLLVVDDELGIRESLKEYFELEGYEVHDAECGERAVEILGQQDFDLVLSDVRMPHGDGRFLLKNVRAKNATCPKVVLMSGFTDLTIEEAYAEGAQAFLTKPFNPQEILLTLSNIAMSAEQRWSQIVESKTAGNLTLVASNFEKAVEQKALSCGQNGFFVPLDPTVYHTGQKIRFTFQDKNEAGIGIIKWIRSKDQGSKVRGFGLEFLSLSPTLQKSVAGYLQNKAPISVIPITL